MQTLLAEKPTDDVIVTEIKEVKPTQNMPNNPIGYACGARIIVEIDSDIRVDENGDRYQIHGDSGFKLLVPETDRGAEAAREQASRMLCTIVDVGPSAFSDTSYWGSDPDRIPEVGQKVWIEKQAGQAFMSEDRKLMTHRLIHSDEIGAIAHPDIGVAK